MADNKTTITIAARDETREAFARINTGLSSMVGAAARLPLLGTALAGAFSGAALATGIKSVIDGADELQKASQKYGVAVEQLSALKYAGALSDVSLEAIGNSLKKLSVNMLDTATGTGEAKDAFKALGISVTDADGVLKSSDQALGEIADKFAGMEDGAGKTALAVKLFGKSGAELIPLLNQGSKGLADMKEEAEKLGVIVGGDLARASEQFNDNLTRLGAAADAFKISIAQEVLPTLSRFVEELVIGVKAAGGFWNALIRFSTINPFKNHQENIRAYSDELAGIERRLQYAIPEKERAALQKDAVVLRQRIAYLKELAQVEALSGTGKGRLDSKDAGPGVLAKAPDLPRKGKEKNEVDDDIRQMQDLGREYEKLWESAEKYVSGLDSQIEKGRTLTQSEQMLLEVERRLPPEWAAAVRPLLERAEAMEKNVASQKRLNEMLENTPSAKLEKTRQDMILLAKAFESGDIKNAEAYFEAVAANLPKLESALDEMTEFTRQAARNMQDAMGSFFFDLMEGKMEDMGTRFKQTINKMLADLMASQLMNWLTGDFGKTGKMGGMLGGLFENFGGARAEGGPVMAGRAYLVGERRPELFVPNQNGTILPHAGGNTFIINVPPGTAPEIRRAAGQGAREAVAALGRARRYA